MAPKKKSTSALEAEAAAADGGAKEEAPEAAAPEGADPPGLAQQEAKEKAEEKAKPTEKAEPEKPKVPEKPKELEEDAPADSRKKLEAEVCWNMSDSTLNVMPIFGGKLLTALSDSGFQHLLASVRANVGMKAGRYMIEAKIMEQAATSHQQPPTKRVVRVGLSLAGTALLSEEDAVYFDNDGCFVNGKKRVKTHHKFNKGSTVAMLINLDASSANADTVSVFVNGTRACEPQKLPEAWKGKALFPIATYKNVTLQVNFGPTAASKLPFACRMLADAAKEDVKVVKAAAGESEVLLPVGLPDQGVFDWADDFLAKNPSYTELSPRKMLDWAVASGLFRKGGKQSNDHPDMGFGVQPIDDLSIMNLAKAIAPFHKGKYLVMELKSNLIAAEREATLAKFPGFKKRAAVLMGEPSAEYKTVVQGRLLDAKKAKAEVERKRKAAEAERKRLAEERQKRLEAAKKARLAGKKEEESEQKEEEKAPAPEEPAEPVTLTDEEKATVFIKHDTPDLSVNALTKYFSSFSVPARSEGFDAIDFLWQNEAASAAHVQDYVLQKKLNSRVDDLQPGEWFKKQLKEWQATLSGWKNRQTQWKNPHQRKAVLAKIAAEKKAAAKKENGGEEKEVEDVEPEPMKIDAEDIDVFSVENVMDIGSGEPLFANFVFEDWALLSLRYELHLLVHAFRKDLNDAERTGFHESHLAFYFNKYFHKQWSNKTYGCNAFKDVVNLVKENIDIKDAGILKALLSEDAPIKSFVHLTEEHRRDRQRRIDAGVESAELKFQRQPQAPQGSPHGHHGGGPHQPTVKPSSHHQQQHGAKRPFPGGHPTSSAQPAWKQAKFQPQFQGGGRFVRR